MNEGERIGVNVKFTRTRKEHLKSRDEKRRMAHLETTLGIFHPTNTQSSKENMKTMHEQVPNERSLSIATKKQNKIK